MLLALAPPPCIALRVAPGVDPESVLFVFFVETLVHAPVLPSVDPELIHNVAAPVANVFSAVRPLVEPVAGYLVIEPLTLVLSAISPFVMTETVLFTVTICSIED